MDYPKGNAAQQRGLPELLLKAKVRTIIFSRIFVPTFGHLIDYFSVFIL